MRKEKAKGKVNLVLMSDRKIRKLNREFRGKDKATDVLAFPYNVAANFSSPYLGDVIISRDTARRNAKRFGVSYRDELKRLVIHGALHILGYDHGRKMKDAEEVYQKL